MKLVLVAGMSGAGRTQALRNMEDMGFFCVDNLPPRLIPQFLKMTLKDRSISRCAVSVDVRAGEHFSDIYDVLESLKEHEIDYEILYLDAADDVLIRRFKETRRNHPLSPEGNLLDGLTKERRENARLKGKAKYVLDTSSYSNKTLKRALAELFSDDAAQDDVLVSVVSFGYKHGIPMDADMVLDVRFLPNPYYNEDLRELTGLDEAVREYVFLDCCTRQYLQKIYELVELTLPYFKTEGKQQLVIAIGCTGGRHRSVAIAQELYAMLLQGGKRAFLEHRHINLDAVKMKDNE
jgi:RNase adapter protein RapZ